MGLKRRKSASAESVLISNSPVSPPHSTHSSLSRKTWRWIPAGCLPTCRNTAADGFTIFLWDFRVGHVVSFVLACVFLLLAAVWLYPSPVEGRAVMGEIGRIFTESVGPWMMFVFLAGAFAATFSTAFNYFDGWPRIVGACCRNLFRSTASLQGN